MRKTRLQTGTGFLVAVVAMVLGSLLAYAVPCIGATGTGRAATVAEVEGTAFLHPDGESESKSVSRGIAVNPWDTVSTKGETKLFLTWDNGIRGALGAFSALLYSPDEDANGPIDEIQIIEGLVRVATEAEQRREPARFFVSTPLAYVEPADFNEPVDFIVEVYDPSKTVVTVVSGRVRIKGPEGREWTEKTVFGCKTVFIEEGKNKIMVLSAGTDDLERLIAATTIAGTIHANMDACRPSTARGPVDPGPPIAYSYPDYPEYYEDVWDVVEYPYWEIRVIRVYGGYCEIWIPGAGHFLVPIPVGGWVFDPAVVEVYAGYAFCHKALLYDQYLWRNLRMRRRELHNMIVLAKQGGNMNLMMKLNRELNDLNIRADWAGRRINRLERRVGELQEKRRKLSGHLPKGFNLDQKISDSLNSQKNLKVMQQFQTQIQNRTNLQNRLAGVAGREIASLKDRITREKDPGKRMALRSELGKIRTAVADGKLPLAKNQKELRNLMTQASKSGDADSQAKARQELLTRLEKQKGIPQTDLVNQKTLAEVRKAVEKQASPQTRQRLEKRIGQIQQSVESRRADEAQLKKIERMTVEAAKESDPEKRREILGTLKELSKPPSGAGAPSTMNLIQQQRNLEQQLGEVKDKQKRDAIQRNIDELKKKQQEQTRQQQLEQEKRVRQQVIGEGDRAKQDQLKRIQEEQGRKAADQLRQQQEKARQTETLRKQQDQQKRLMEQKAREQQDKARQADQLRQQQEKARQTETLRKQQEQQKRLMEQKAREQQDKARQADQLRQQQEKARQTETLRKQQEQQKRLMEQKAREQQDKARQADQLKQQQLRQQQLRQQQEKARQADQLRQQQLKQQQLRQQQEKARQADQLRQQQLKQQQLRQQQMRQQQIQQQQRARQADQLRQQQMRQQQMQLQQQKARQAVQARQQQMRQQQMQLQQQKARQQQILQQQEAAKKALERRR